LEVISNRWDRKLKLLESNLPATQYSIYPGFGSDELTALLLIEKAGSAIFPAARFVPGTG
jgi:hypothetical protein